MGTATAHARRAWPSRHAPGSASGGHNRTTCTGPLETTLPSWPGLFPVPYFRLPPARKESYDCPALEGAANYFSKRTTCTKAHGAAAAQTATAQPASRVRGRGASNRSFTRAAEELGVTQGAVSARSTRWKSGWAWCCSSANGGRVGAAPGYPAVRDRGGRCLRAYRRRDRRLAATHANAVLVVRGYTTFLTRWLVPPPARLPEKHPDIDLRLVSGSAPVDFEHDAVDVGIRYGHGVWRWLPGRPAVPRRVAAGLPPRLHRGARRGPVQPARLGHLAAPQPAPRRTGRTGLPPPGTRASAPGPSPLFRGSGHRLRERRAPAWGSPWASGHTCRPRWRPGRCARRSATLLQRPLGTTSSAARRPCPTSPKSSGRSATGSWARPGLRP